MLRRLRYALIGDGASDGTRQKQRSSHLAKTLGTLKDALVPYGRSSFGDPRYKVTPPLAGRRDVRHTVRRGPQGGRRPTHGRGRGLLQE